MLRREGEVFLFGTAMAATPLSAPEPRRRATIELLHRGPNRQASAQCHADIAGLALASGADIVAGIGEFAPALEKQNQRERVITAPDVDDLWPLVSDPTMRSLLPSSPLPRT